jgi:hypothetical protein
MVKVKENYQSRDKDIMNYKNKKHGILRKLNTMNGQTSAGKKASK